MTKEEKKRIYEAQTILPANFRLESALLEREKRVETDHPPELQKQRFSMELIARLTERIKKL